MNYYGYGYDGYGMMGGFGIIDAVFHVLWLILVVWFVVWVARMVFGRGKAHHRMMWHTSSAIDILNERFAKGEIERAEYEEKKKALLG